MLGNVQVEQFIETPILCPDAVHGAAGGCRRRAWEGRAVFFLASSFHDVWHRTISTASCCICVGKSPQFCPVLVLEIWTPEGLGQWEQDEQVPCERFQRLVDGPLLRGPIQSAHQAVKPLHRPFDDVDLNVDKWARAPHADVSRHDGKQIPHLFDQNTHFLGLDETIHRRSWEPKKRFGAVDFLKRIFERREDQATFVDPPVRGSLHGNETVRLRWDRHVF